MQLESENKISSPQEEIEYLKQRISDLEKNTSENKEFLPVKEAIREHSEKVPENILSDEHRFGEKEIEEHSQDLSTKVAEGEHQRAISELIQIAHDKGVLNSLSVVKKINDPHLEDDFHDALIKYFQTVHNV